MIQFEEELRDEDFNFDAVERDEFTSSICDHGEPMDVCSDCYADDLEYIKALSNTYSEYYD